MLKRPPFNPETWFPYVLGEDTMAQVRIYAAGGQLVRELDLGFQKAGAYLERDAAAYWDGQDSAGTPVSSGIYFYQLSAGDYSATRKMVIVK